MNTWCITWISIAAVTAGCSGGSNSGSTGAADSCGKVAPCGGNIVGTWKIAEECSTSGSSPMPIAGGCAGETEQLNSTHASGTLTVNADMTYTISETTSVAETVIFPTSCLTFGGVTLTCNQLATTLSASLPGDAGLGSFSTTCATSGSGCTCTATNSGTQVTASGTYSTSGTGTLTISPSGSAAMSGGYCVQGDNTLHIISPSTAVGTSTMGQLMGAMSTDLVATK